MNLYNRVHMTYTGEQSQIRVNPLALSVIVYRQRVEVLPR